MAAMQQFRPSKLKPGPAPAARRGTPRAGGSSIARVCVEGGSVAQLRAMRLYSLCALLAGGCATVTEAGMPPIVATRIEPTREQRFGITVEDPYRWLEDGSSVEVKAWMGAEDRAARQALHALPGRDALAARLRALYYVDSVGAPRHRGGRYFYARTRADREKAIVYVRDGEQGAERVLLDPNAMSTDGTVSVGMWSPSRDGRTLAYSLNANNSDEATLHLLDVESGVTSAVDVIAGAKYATPSWTPDGTAFYYVWLPTDGAVAAAERPGLAEVRLHRVGTDPSRDEVIRGATHDPTTFLGVELSHDGHWLFLYLQHGWTSTDVFFRDARRGGEFRPFIEGADATFSVEAWRDRFYVQTNDGAPRGRLIVADPARPERAAWREIVAEAGDGAVLESAEIVGEHLALTWLRNASNELEVRTLDGAPLRKLPLPGLGSVHGVVGNPDEDDAWFAFSSFTRPLTIYRTSIARGTTSTWAEVRLPIDPDPYVVEQVFYPSKDGTRISMFLVHRKDLPRDGTTPFLLTGYGGFNLSMLPSFSSGLYPWLEAGGGYALPNLRGGGEYGEAWHRAGQGAHKQNVFDDFLAAARFLIEHRYTSRERLAIRGGSNGGLLVGAATTQAPEAFRAVVCSAPLLDMVRYVLFGSGRTWISEYGSPDEELPFKALHAYSPYHHVRRGPYPALLMLSPDSDDRVDPLHARKMTAALQAASTSGHPIWLRIEPHSGHGGADLVKQAVDQSADVYAFLMHELGMKPPR